MFENAYTRCLKIDLAPQASMIVHHHPNDYIFTVLALRRSKR